MSIQKKPSSKLDNLMGSTIQGSEIELTENELNNVSGGASSDTFLTLDGIKGESKDDQHKDTIEMVSIKKGK